MKKTAKEWYEYQKEKGFNYLVFGWKLEDNKLITLREFEKNYCR